jgi:hypothetical protein
MEMQGASQASSVVVGRDVPKPRLSITLSRQGSALAHKSSAINKFCVNLPSHEALVMRNKHMRTNKKYPIHTLNHVDIVPSSMSGDQS